MSALNDPPARHSANHQSSVDHVPLNPSPPCPRPPPHTPHTATPPPLPAFTHKQHLHIDRTLACTASLAWRAQQPPPTQPHRFSSHHPSNTHPRSRCHAAPVRFASPPRDHSRCYYHPVRGHAGGSYAVAPTCPDMPHQPTLNLVLALGCTLTAVNRQAPHRC